MDRVDPRGLSVEHDVHRISVDGAWRLLPDLGRHPANEYPDLHATAQYFDWFRRYEPRLVAQHHQHEDAGGAAGNLPLAGIEGSVGEIGLGGPRGPHVSRRPG